MTATRTSLEEALNHLINENHEAAVEAFHAFVVKKAQSIHESLQEEDDLDNEIDEAVDEDETVDESADSDDETVDESFEEVDEDFGEDRNQIEADEYFGRDELTTEDDDDMGDMGDEEAADDLEAAGDEAGEGEEVTLDAGDVEDLTSSMEELTAKFHELMGGEHMDHEGDEEMDHEEPEMDMDMEEPAEESMESGQFESVESELDEDEEEVDEAVTHDPGVQSQHLTDEEGNHGNRDSIKHNSDAKLPESATYDFDLTEEDFMDLEEGLKTVDVKMGGEQGGGKYAGEETNVKSPVAQRDKSDVKADAKSMVSKRDDHNGYDLENAPSHGDLPHSGDNSRDHASTGTSQVAKGGGLEKQKSYGEGEVGVGKYAGQETNVKSPIGSAGTRNES